MDSYSLIGNFNDFQILGKLNLNKFNLKYNDFLFESNRIVAINNMNIVLFNANTYLIYKEIFIPNKL
jgi:hypothetical protein